MYSVIRSNRVFERVVLIVVGSAGSAFGYLLTVKAHLGDGPLFTVQDGLHRHLGVSLGATSILVGLTIAAVAALLGAHLGAGTIAVPVLAGLFIDRLDPLIRVEGALWLRWTAFIGGTAIMMLGGVLALGASLGSSALDGIMIRIARHAGRSPSSIRILMEVALAATGAAIGGRVGLGTVVMGLLVGPFFVGWSRALERCGLPIEPVRTTDARPRAAISAQQ